MSRTARSPLPDTLRELVQERERLLQGYAHVMRRVGASHPSRRTENARRAQLRKQYRQDLRINAERIAVEVAKVYGTSTKHLFINDLSPTDIFHTENTR